MTTSALTMDVVIPTFDNLDELRACLDALAGQDRRDLRALVCVDGSSDGTLEWLRSARLPFALEVLEHPDGRNHGRSAARNLALARLAAPWVLLLDSDMRLASSGISDHLALLGDRPCISVGDVVYENAAANLWARYQATRGRNKAVHGARLRPLDFNSQNVAMASEDFRAAGGFDDSLTEWGGEDTELGIRLAETGRLLIFNARAAAHTLETKPVAAGLAQLHRFARTNLPAIRRRHPSGPAPFWIDRLESHRWRDRLLRLALNPVSDVVVDALLPRVPFALQRHLLNYKVIRTVFRAYSEATR